jgi:hypothetical protein
MGNSSNTEWINGFLAESIPMWRNDPVLFMREVLVFKPDGWQMKVAYDVRDYPRVSVKSGQGVGKTGLEAAMLLWFLVCFPYARVVATAPTRQQLNDVLWSEVDKWMNNSPLLPLMLKWTKTYVYVKGYEKRWFAVARTATKPENMQGFHEDNMLFIVDEASGVADPIMEAVTGTLAGENNKLLLMGNPTRKSGVFYESHTADASLYRRHTVNAEESARTNKENINAMKRKYGADSNVVRVRVYGEFPEQEDDVFIPFPWLEASIHAEISENTARGLGIYKDAAGKLQPQDESRIYRIEIGCDVARFGDDKTCIGYRINEVVRIYRKYNGQDTAWTTGSIALLYKELKSRCRFKGQIGIKVDDSGVGGGVVDQLRCYVRTEPETYGDMEILPVIFGQPIRHRYYHDSTTYMMGIIKDLIAPFDDDGKEHKPEVLFYQQCKTESGKQKRNEGTWDYVT